MRVPKNRPPTHPGEMLEMEFLAPLGLTQTELARMIGVPFQRINRIVRLKQAVTVDTAVRLARLFGTSVQFWLNLQHAWDVYQAVNSDEAKKVARQVKPLKTLTPVRVAG